MTKCVVECRVHKEHHESFNPDPFSGLSMHWAESTIYFSSAILISPIVPLWVFRLLSLGLLVSVLVSCPVNTWSFDTHLQHLLTFSNMIRETVKYYFADFVRKEGTPPPYGFFFRQKRSYGFGGYPPPPLYGFSPKNVL